MRELQAQTQIPCGNNNQNTEEAFYIRVLPCRNPIFGLCRVVILYEVRDACTRQSRNAVHIAKSAISAVEYGSDVPAHTESGAL